MSKVLAEKNTQGRELKGKKRILSSRERGLARRREIPMRRHHLRLREMD
jgi:hypothetical protein